ncbi:MAG: protein kinase, partial [Pyrinomonadaceae bacterium]|nr:protein kinase [Pyrinomonadaceae bacterium]
TLIGQTLAGKYRVDEFLSEGGMGTVYRGTHILMDKIVAIKVLHPALAADDKIVARFSREARAASRISHPHALNVTDFGESEDGIVFLVMEFLNGRTLKEVVRTDGSMPLVRAVEIMRQVCGALEAAHAENVVHRDLKSDNIMLLDVGGGDWVKVLDFGIAKIQETDGRDPDLTAPNLIIGTPQYMSPEQCSQASEIDSRSDIYSLGVILFELLAGHVPFVGESATAVMMQHLQDEPPDVLAERSDLPPEVGQVVARALAKKPGDRFQTATELSESLTLAAEKEVPEEALTGAATQEVSDSNTNRIVVPTGTNDPPRSTIEDDYDETTMVRPSPALTTPVVVTETVPPPAPPANNVNSWKMAVIALVGMIAIGGALYAFTRSQTTNEQQTPPLTVDPNGQPVQPAAPPTGGGEQGIAPNVPAPANTNTNTNANTSDANQNQNTEMPLLPPAEVNLNDNTQANDNSSGQNNSSNSNSNQNANAGTKPSPTAPVEVDDPPPMPSPTAKQKKKQGSTPNPEPPQGAGGQPPQLQTSSNPQL